MLLSEVVATSHEVRSTRSRLQKVAHLARALGRLQPEETAAGAAYLAGELRQRQTGVGWAALRELPPPAAEPELTVAAVDAAFAHISGIAGAGSQRARREAIAGLFGRATAAEQEFLRALALGDLRQGALESVVIDAIAEASGVPKADVRRAHMLGGGLAAVATTALCDGLEAVRAVRLQVGRPVKPMLASPAADIHDAMERIAPAAIEFKLDGARVQVHRSGGDVAAFTRSLEEVTSRVPEVVEAALALPVSEVVLDGEVIALREDGRPHPFQVTGARFARRRSGAQVPLSFFAFDVLHAGGQDLIDRPARERDEVLEAMTPARIPRAVVEDAESAGAFLADALARGHEGVMVKDLDAPYAAGSRGSAWLKVKPRHTLDLVVLAAEWGHGRRRGLLSNLHLGARHEDGFVMLGKTFKGLTDAMLAWQTERLLELATDRGDWVVRVRPELVVEIAFDGVQTSPRYPGGVALRFARVLRHRPDKRAGEADTLASVLAIHGQH